MGYTRILNWLETSPCNMELWNSSYWLLTSIVTNLIGIYFFFFFFQTLIMNLNFYHRLYYWPLNTLVLSLRQMLKTTKEWMEQLRVYMLRDLLSSIIKLIEIKFMRPIIKYPGTRIWIFLFLRNLGRASCKLVEFLNYT